MFHSQSGMKITAFLTNTPPFSNQLLQLHDKHHFSIISWLNVRWSKSFANFISSLNSHYITQAAIHSPYYIHYNLYFVVHDTNSISRVSEFPIKIAGEKSGETIVHCVIRRAHCGVWIARKKTRWTQFECFLHLSYLSIPNALCSNVWSPLLNIISTKYHFVVLWAAFFFSLSEENFLPLVHVISFEAVLISSLKWCYYY